MYVIQRICITVKATRCSLKCGCTPDLVEKSCEICFLEQLPGRDGPIVDVDRGVKDDWETPHIVGSEPCISRGIASISAQVVATNDKDLIDKITWEPEGRVSCGDFNVNLGKHAPVPSWFSNVTSAWFNSKDRTYQTASGQLMTSWNCCPIDPPLEENYYGKFGLTVITWQGMGGFGYKVVNCTRPSQTRF